MRRFSMGLKCGSFLRSISIQLYREEDLHGGGEETLGRAALYVSGVEAAAVTAHSRRRGGDPGGLV